MIKFDYSFSREWEHNVNDIDLRRADETVLRYSAFLGDIIVRVDDIELGTNFGWVPIIDYAICLKQIVVNLGVPEIEEAIFDFTESDAIIRFMKKERHVEIMPSYTTASGKASFDDFVAAVDAFIAHLRSDVINQFPLLNCNQAFIHLMNTACRIPDDWIRMSCA
jgi:hypothetical protein